MENLAVILILALAVGYVARSFYRKSKGKEGCCSGCSACDADP